MEIFLAILISVAIGLIIGMLSGLLGVGGGTVLVPVFKLLYGMPGIVATATSLFTIIPTSISGVITHVRNKTCYPRLGVAAGIGGAITSPIGVWLASMSPEWAIMVVAALVIGYSAVTMFGKALKLKRQKANLRNAPSEAEPPQQDAGSAQSEPPATIEGKKLLIGALIGLCAGVVSGYVGVGGGFIMVPMFMQLLRTPMKATSGTSLIAVMILAIPGTITQAMLGNVDWLAGIFIALGTIPGAVIGSRMIKRVSELSLRFGFSIFLLVAAVLLILNQLNVF